MFAGGWATAGLGGKVDVTGVVLIALDEDIETGVVGVTFAGFDCDEFGCPDAEFDGFWDCGEGFWFGFWHGIWFEFRFGFWLEFWFGFWGGWLNGGKGQNGDQGGTCGCWTWSWPDWPWDECCPFPEFQGPESQGPKISDILGIFGNIWGEFGWLSPGGPFGLPFSQFCGAPNTVV